MSKQSLLEMLAKWARWHACVDDDSTIYEFLRERGKDLAEGLDLDNPPEEADDGERPPV